MPEPTHSRREHEFPSAIAQRGWRYHHCGIPTDEVRAGERYLPQFGMYVSGFAESEFGVEWMRFEEGSPIAELIQRVPHLAFVVDDLDAALEGREVLTWPNAPSDGIRVAMIIENGAPIELMSINDDTSFSGNTDLHGSY
ncbi:VOC family protein [bacterium]|nr:VOC family protein [bacterium]